MNVTEREGTEQGAWPGAIAAITLFVEDLEAAKRFYLEVFELPVVFEDDNSTVFRFGETLVNLLKTSEAPGLVEPATVAARDAGVRFQFTLSVDDVDAMCEELKERGVELLNWTDGSTMGDPHCQLPGPGRAHLGDRPLATNGRHHRLRQCSRMSLERRPRFSPYPR